MLKKTVLIILVSIMLLLIIPKEMRFRKNKNENLARQSNLVVDLQQGEKKICVITTAIFEEEKTKEKVEKETMPSNINNTNKGNITEKKVSKETKKETREETQKVDTVKNQKEEIKETKKEIPKKEESVAKEPIITYNENETIKIKETIEKFAKENSSLVTLEGKKNYKIVIDKKAMKNNYFSPFRENQVESIVTNVFSCTFVIYAVSYEKDGMEKEYRYYIGIQNY